jgi:hypothetical protein
LLYVSPIERRNVLRNDPSDEIAQRSAVFLREYTQLGDA